MCVWECEENSRCVHSKESHDWISWLASRQSGTRVKHAGSWRVTTTGELQDKKYSLAWQLPHNSNSRLVPTVRPSHQNALFYWKLTFHIPHISYYKYPYTHEIQRISRENFERETLKKTKIDLSTIFAFWFSNPLLSPSPLTYHWEVYWPNLYLTIPISVMRYFGTWEAVQRGQIRLVDAMGLLRDLKS